MRLARHLSPRLLFRSLGWPLRQSGLSASVSAGFFGPSAFLRPPLAPLADSPGTGGMSPGKRTPRVGFLAQLDGLLPWPAAASLERSCMEHRGGCGGEQRLAANGAAFSPASLGFSKRGLAGIGRQTRMTQTGGSGRCWFPCRGRSGAASTARTESIFWTGRQSLWPAQSWVWRPVPVIQCFSAPPPHPEAAWIRRTFRYSYIQRLGCMLNGGMKETSRYRC